MNSLIENINRDAAINRSIAGLVSAVETDPAPRA
jgi:hypothetical protein